VKRTVQVTLAGKEYTIRSEASAEEIRRVATFVNDQISEVASGGVTVDSLGSAVLALMNVSGAYLRLREEKHLDAESVERLRRLAERLDRAVPSR
jgi:cell division protein ZapA